MNRLSLRATLLAATLLTSSAALAQSNDVFDYQQLPVFHGRVAQYDLTPRGDVGGVILDDGTEVLLPPHLGAQVVATVKPGDSVTIHGLKARTLPLVQAMSLANDATRAVVTDGGPPREGPGRGPEHGPMGGPRGEGGSPMDAGGVIKAQLHGPRGELNGVLLQDGTIVRLPPPEATRVADQLAPGQTVFVRGDGAASALGKWIDARAIGPAEDRLVRFERPEGHRPPPPPPRPQ